MTDRSPLVQLLIVVAILAVAVLAGNAVGTARMERLMIPVGGLILFITVVNPFASLIIFLVSFTRFGSYEQIGPVQIVMAAYTVLLFLIALARFLWRDSWDRAATRAVTLMFALGAFLCLSLVVAAGNQIGFTDWGRGAYPLVVLCLGAVFVTTLQSRNQWNVAAVVFLLIMLAQGMGSVQELGGRVGLSTGGGEVVSWGSTLLPALLTSLGVAMIIEKRQLHWLYVAFVVMGLFTAVLSPTRTVWIAAALTIAILAMVTFFRQRRPGVAVAVVSIAALIAGGTLLAWRYSGPEESWGQQSARFATLQDVSEDQSVQIRQEQVREAFRVFVDAPILGAGLGYMYNYNIAHTSKYEKPNDFNHSDLANFLAKTGIVGTALLYWLMITTVLAAVRLQKVAVVPEDRAMGLAAECTLIVALVIGNSTPMMQQKGSSFVLALIIGLVLSRLNILYREAVEVELAAEEGRQPGEALGALPLVTITHR